MTSMRHSIVSETSLAGLKVFERKPFGDDRGYFSRLFCAKELAAAGWNKPVSQINYSVTRTRGTIRGMHFQYPPNAEMKLVSCLRGEVWDVVVDIRAGSPTLMKWHSEVLSSSNCRALLIPEGFAHGFQALTDNCELIYIHSNEYSPTAEAGINAEDPMLSVNWPLPLEKISLKDKRHPMLERDFSGVIL